MIPSRLTVWDRVAIVEIALLCAAAAYVLRYGPDVPVPVHFDVHGQVDRWGDRSEAALMIFVCALVTLAVHLTLNWAATHGTLGRQSERTLAVGRITGLAAPAMAALPMVYLGAGLAQDARPETALVIALMGAWGLITFAGAAVGKTAPNPWIGLRVYWTHKSRLAWDKSNRLIGRVYFFGGLGGLIITPFVAFESRIALLIAVTVGGMIAGLVEAWRTWRIDPERG